VTIGLQNQIHLIMIIIINILLRFYQLMSIKSIFIWIQKIRWKGLWVFY